MASTFYERLIESADRRRNRVPMTSLGPEGAHNLTYGGMLARVRGIAYRLSLEQIEPGDRTALIGENHPHRAIARYGILYRGAIAVSLAPAVPLTHNNIYAESRADAKTTIIKKKF